MTSMADILKDNIIHFKLLKINSAIHTLTIQLLFLQTEGENEFFNMY